MSKGFPKITKSSQTGEIGVNMVARIVTNELGWLFRRNHNEHDFGIDGYIDLITPDQAVTGRSLAVQIKCGDSYLSRKNEYGYLYYGENKHLNYLINFPLHVLIILCDSHTDRCYWELFDPSKTEPTKTGWKLLVPYEQVFTQIAKSALEEIAGPSIDYLDELKAYWEINKLISENSSKVSYIIDKEDITSHNFKDVVSFFERLKVTREFARKNQGKVELFVSGYDDDPRELWEITEVVDFFKQLEPMVRYWFYFLSSDVKVIGLKLLFYCLCSAQWKDGRPKNFGEKHQIEINPDELPGFITRNYQWLNEIAAWVHLPESEIERISFAVATQLGYDENQ